MEQPSLGWTTPVEIVKVIDGDTVRIRIVREVDVRITDDEGTFDTPETWRPKSAEEKVLGLAATSFMKQLLFKWTVGWTKIRTYGSQRDNIVLHVPTDERGRVKDIFSIGARVVGHLFVDGVDVTDEMKKAGHTKKDSK